MSCHGGTQCWYDGFYPWWGWPEFHGGAPIALEPSAELETQAKVVFIMLVLWSL
jgi:hypothetical protein